MTGQEMRAVRKRWRMTQEEFAAKLGIGDRAHVSHMETGARKVRATLEMLILATPPPPEPIRKVRTKEEWKQYRLDQMKKRYKKHRKTVLSWKKPTHECVACGKKWRNTDPTNIRAHLCPECQAREDDDYAGF